MDENKHSTLGSDSVYLNMNGLVLTAIPTLSWNGVVEVWKVFLDKKHVARIRRCEGHVHLESEDGILDFQVPDKNLAIAAYSSFLLSRSEYRENLADS